MRIKEDKIQIYDMAIDAFRDLAASDVEKFENAVASLGMLRDGLRKLLEVTLRVARGEIEAPYSIADFNVTTFPEK